MNRTIDPQYRFSFTGANGRRYARQHYWETLYAFAYGGRQIVAAARVVPFSSTREALYTAFKGERRDAITQHLLPEAIREPLLSVAQNENALRTFVDNVTALVPKQTSELPEERLEKTGAELEETVSMAMATQGIEGGLSSFASTETAPFLTRDDEAFQALSREALDADDAAIINLSVHVDAALKTQLRNALEAHADAGALVPHGDLEFDLSARLYSNPQYLAFVRRLIDAKGSYVSPVVRDFLSFYTRCLNAKLAEHIRATHADPDVLRGRLDSILGREKGGAHYYLDYHDLAILGTLEAGEISPDATDPDQTGACYKIDPGVDAGDILLREIEEQRFLVRKFIEHTFNVHHNIKSVRFIDEIEAEKQTSRITHPLIDTLDDWIKRNQLALIQGGFFLLVVCIFGVLGILFFWFLEISGP